MVMMTMKAKRKHKFQNHGPCVKFNIDRLRDPQVDGRFELTIGEIGENIDGTLTDTTSEVLSGAGKKNRRWLINDILDLCDKKSFKKTRKDYHVATQNKVIITMVIKPLDDPT